MAKGGYIRISPSVFYRLGFTAFLGAAVLGIALVLYLAWLIPDGTIFLPVLLLGGVAGWKIFQYPLTGSGG